jgi:glycosyltransferase involved in cell wall biosynthesis
MTQRRPVLKRWSTALVERPLLQRADAVHFTSTAEASRAQDLGLRLRPAVIPLGVEMSELHSDRAYQKPREFNLLFLSRLDPKKNVESLLKATRLVMNDDESPFRLIVAGGGEKAYIAHLRSLADSLRISHRVTWLGHIEGMQKKATLEAADAFVLPSYSENFGLSVAEALAAGLPCIVSSQVALAPEIKTWGAGTVTETDPESIAYGIRRIIRRMTSTSDLSKAARKLACRNYSLDVMGERLDALYRSVLRGAKDQQLSRQVL